MTRGAALFLLLSVASSCASAGAWSDLWSTHEQQGQRLLQQHPDRAAKLFSDPRRRGYAELAAGHYQQAAELLKPFGDADSQYNRGNALTRSGQLKDALAAYDAALKQAPQDADIRHNRDLVAQALKGQPPEKAPQQGGRQGGKDGQGQPKDNNSGKDKDSLGQNQGQQSSSQNGRNVAQNGGQRGGQNGQGQQQHSQGSPGNQDSRQAQRGQESQSGSGAQQAQSPQGQQPQGFSGGSPQSRQATAAAGPSNSPNGNQSQGALQSHGQSSAASSNPGDLARQAQADAAAGAQYLRDQKNARGSTRGPDIDDPRHAAPTGAPSPPPSEESLALDQWLQRIPEDSGELLRRKFRIEHNMRHPEQDVEP